MDDCAGHGFTPRLEPEYRDVDQGGRRRACEHKQGPPPVLRTGARVEKSSYPVIRSSTPFAAVLALLASNAHADEDRGALRLFELILTLKNRPPQGETAVLIGRKLEEAEIRESDMFEVGSA